MERGKLMERKDRLVRHIHTFTRAGLVDLFATNLTGLVV